MKVQKVRLSPNRYSYIVLDDKHLPIQPILSYIRYLDNTDKSSHTVRAYANHLKLYWDYLGEYHLDWAKITLEGLSGFVGWLRNTNQSQNVIDLRESLNRKSTTINSILGCLSSFYRYHNHAGNTDVTLNETVNLPGSRYKSLLHHVCRDKPSQRRIISMRHYKKLPATISQTQFQLVMDACTNARDKFLISLLYETGMRIGQVLSLRHEDIVSWDNVIHLQPRNENDVRSKTVSFNTIHVSKDLMGLYTNYVNSFDLSDPSSHVFINLHNYEPPLRYTAVRKLFKVISEKVNFKITAHMLRHTHATELIKTGVDSSLVQKRLGHASVQTTINTYTHIDDETMKHALQSYWSKRGDDNE